MSTDVTNPPALPPADPAAAKPTSIPWWTRGDTNAFFGLGFNILVNVLTLTGLMIGVIQVPAGDVLGTVLPALGVALILGNLYYTFLARRLAKKENRTDVTALPYGPSVPHMFIVIFVVMLPVYLNTNDAMKAWEAGLAWAFMIGIIVMIGAFVGPYIRKLTPRAAMLGTLAGISITFISMRPAAQMWEAAWIGLPVMAIILIGFFTNMKLPFGIPVGLAALLVGTAIGWIGGFMSAPDVGQAVSDIAIGIPDLRVYYVHGSIAWVEYWGEQADDHYRRHRYWAGSDLPHPPSHYFKANLMHNFTVDPVGLQIRDMLDVDNLMWSRVFPAAHGTWPRSAAAIEEQFAEAGVPDDERRRMLADNALSFFGLAANRRQETSYSPSS